MSASVRPSYVSRVRRRVEGRAGIRCGPAGRRAVALTFDDGPSSCTGDVLAALNDACARATFFPIGKLVADDPPTVAAVADSGHEVGIHGWSHERLTLDNVQTEVDRSVAAISRITGKRPNFLRPPYGSCSRRVVRRATAMGVTTVRWSVDSEDWRGAGPAAVVDRVARAVRPGSIILLHDAARARFGSAEVTRNLLEVLSASGYEFLTVSELLGVTDGCSRSRAG